MCILCVRERVGDTVRQRVCVGVDGVGGMRETERERERETESVCVGVDGVGDMRERDAERETESVCRRRWRRRYVRVCFVRERESVCVCVCVCACV